MHSIVSFAPAADICFSASRQIVSTAPLLSPALATQPHSAHACTSHPAHSNFASTRLSQAVGSRKHSALASTRLPTAAHGSAFSQSSPHVKAHLGGAVLPTRMLVCRGETHLSGASQLTSLPIRRSSPAHLISQVCLSGGVLPTPILVCGGETHLSGASQITSLPTRRNSTHSDSWVRRATPTEPVQLSSYICLGSAVLRTPKRV